ncbi:HPr family phosphocarrier protein [Aerophototrophica crusticola]|uniref:HPr family phosphocarrier protein n=2 Tax=Aerophototrophica crusticola TaxID=1709002 RepID=A0A858RBW4_9PROT|nr:HPr family phosphocarrier protein [Rhodospirillaceae bacterium B3]
MTQELAGAAPLTATVTIVNRRGLHARAAAKFVRTVGEYQAEVEVVRGETAVNGESIMGLMMLAAGIGSSITLTASGPQATEVMAALVALVQGKFGEED